MIVYHGGIQVVQEPRIIRAEIGRDFGFAFYTTDIKTQAERWAVRKARIENRKPDRQAKAVISVFEWDVDASGLNFKQFSDASLEWLELVVNCRSDRMYEHPFDIVTGKIANDNVGETVAYVMQGIMRKEDAIERLKFEKINNQIAFCTPKALQTLTYLEHYTLGE